MQERLLDWLAAFVWGVVRGARRLGGPSVLAAMSFTALAVYLGTTWALTEQRNPEEYNDWWDVVLFALVAWFTFGAIGSAVNVGERLNREQEKAIRMGFSIAKAASLLQALPPNTTLTVTATHDGIEAFVEPTKDEATPESNQA